MECFLSILIRYRRVYGMVVFSEFCGHFLCSFDSKGDRRRYCLGFEPKLKKRRRLRCLPKAKLFKHPRKQTTHYVMTTSKKKKKKEEEEEEEDSYNIINAFLFEFVFAIVFSETFASRSR
jgi:hypothetical protein